MRHGILRQKRRLEPDLSPDPFALAMRRIGRMIAASSTAKLRPEIRRLDLLKLLDLAPGSIAYRTGDIDFELQD